MILRYEYEMPKVKSKTKLVDKEVFFYINLVTRIRNNHMPIDQTRKINFDEVGLYMPNKCLVTSQSITIIVKLVPDMEDFPHRCGQEA